MPSVEEDPEYESEQIPVGICETGLSKKTGTPTEALVFPDTDALVQTLDELDSEILDDEEDAVYDPQEDAQREHSTQSDEEEDDKMSDSESVDEEDLVGVKEVESSNGNHVKLQFDDVLKSRPEEEDEEEEPSEDVEDKMYNEAEDADFNPVYADQTLSDVEENEGEEEADTEVINVGQGGTNLMIRCDFIKIPPPEVQTIQVPPVTVNANIVEQVMECE